MIDKDKDIYVGWLGRKKENEAIKVDTLIEIAWQLKEANKLTVETHRLMGYLVED